LTYDAPTFNYDVPQSVHEVTGKERDAESGLDEFGARYYASPLGRFMTPDWATTPIDVPYADFGNPQSLNLYSYVKNNPTTFGDPDGHCCWEEVKASTIFLGQEVVGLGKGVINAVPSAYNVGAELLNEQGAASGQPYMKLEMAPTIPLNNTGEVVGAAVGSLGLVLLGGVEGGGLRGATAETGEAATAETAGRAAVPESIPAGPSARPTAAQQSAINEMGEAHGCSTCGATTPGTKSGNWVGDHQPPTALNKDGGPQVYKPQCLQCSRQQGGQVAAAVRAAKKQDQPQQ
jgi:RHS repeat-associated protein